MAKSPLGLSGIPRIEGLQVKGFLLIKNDEFVFVADTLKEWQRVRQSLANFVEDQDHREELLQDLSHIRDWAALEVRKEKTKPADEQAHKFIERREYFISSTFPYQESQLLAWQPTMTDQVDIDFVTLNGRCTLIREHDRVTMLLIQSLTTSTFSVFWKRAGDVASDLGKPIKENFGINNGKTVAIKFSTPKEDGLLNIYDHALNAIERIPL